MGWPTTVYKSHSSSIRRAIVVLVIVTALCAPANAGQESFNFEPNSPIFGWFPQTINSSPFGGHALGPFGNQTVTQAILDALPDGTGAFQYAPRTVALSFDLILFDPWLGNTPGAQSIFQVTENGTTLLQTTFSTDTAAQSYPNSLGAGSSPAGTGAVAFYPGYVADYRINTTFPLYANFSNSTDISINFSASGLTDGAAWQLDNVVVDWNQPVPEPNGFALLALGMAFVVANRLSARAKTL